MMSFKNSIACITFFIVNLLSLCNLHAEQFIPTIVHQFIWAEQNQHQNSFTGLSIHTNNRRSFHNFQQIFRQLISQCYPIYLENYLLPGLPHDCNLIEKIRADNPHYPQGTLLSKLAHNENINQMSSYYRFDKDAWYISENIIINPEYFKGLPQADVRVNEILQAATKTTKERQTKEITALDASYNKAKKHQPKAQKVVLENQYKKDKNNLKLKHQQELKDGPFLNAQKIVRAEYQRKYQTQTLHNMLDQHDNLIKQQPHQVSKNDQFVQTMQARDQAIRTSLQNTVATEKLHCLTHQTTGFLQAHNINPQQFQALHGIEIQHQFTQELISVLDSVADFSLKNPYQTLHHNLALHCANLASLTQQANSLQNLVAVEQGVNCCHGIDHFMQGISAPDTYSRDQQMATALDYCNAVARGALKGAGTAVAVSAATAVGLAIAPTTTGIILGAAAVATAIHIGTLCGQGLMHAYTLGNYCVHGDYDKVDTYLQKAYQSITNLENIEQTTAYVTGFITAYKGLPALQNLQKSFDFHPVIATIEQASGQVYTLNIQE